MARYANNSSASVSERQLPSLPTEVHGIRHSVGRLMHRLGGGRPSRRAVQLPAAPP